MLSPFERAVNKILQMESVSGSYDEADRKFWEETLRTGMREFFKESEDIVTILAKEMQQYSTQRSDTWDLIDSHRQERIWKKQARAILSKVRDMV